MQKYCPDCSKTAVGKTIREQKKKYGSEHQEIRQERKRLLANERRVCAVCGKVTGNGNDMDYFAAVFLKVENTALEEIDACLAELREEYTVGAQIQTAPAMENRHLGHDDIIFDADFEEGETYVAVYATYGDYGFWATLDTRAH